MTKQTSTQTTLTTEQETQLEFIAHLRQCCLDEIETIELSESQVVTKSPPLTSLLSAIHEIDNNDHGSIDDQLSTIYCIINLASDTGETEVIRLMYSRLKEIHSEIISPNSHKQVD